MSNAPLHTPEEVFNMRRHWSRLRQAVTLSGRMLKRPWLYTLDEPYTP
jgi:hypothetical protein